jgi:para-nitrobenzyl esterase
MVGVPPWEPGTKMRAAPRLETRSGVVEGRRTDGVCRFHGVPFAAPPVGALRWAPPVREAPFAEMRDGTRPAPAAPQRPSALMRMLGMDDATQSEDCLTLEAWTPEPDPRARRPVLVWLHGGGFTAGAGSLPAFDGAHLARRDVVVIAPNYRLGALGFLCVEERDGGGLSANFGLQDQIAALAWVREHAAPLGGDPDQVTVFGESAGAMSIGALLGAPAARGLFRRAILQSGAAHNVSPPTAGRRIAGLFRDALAARGADGGDLAAWRALPVSAVLDAQQRVIDESWRHVDGLAFQPVADGAVLPRQPLASVAAGDTRSVSLLVGTNLDEWNLFALTDAKLASLDDEGVVRRFLRAPPDPAAPPETRAALARRALEVYRQARKPTATASELWLAMQTDRVFRLPAIRLLEAQGGHAPCFSYLFTWRSPALDGRLGACHGVEIPFVFGTHRDERAARLVGEGPDADRLAERMQDAWLSFARRGDPGWPAYDAVARATRLAGLEWRVEPDPMGAERRFWDGVI